MAITDSIETRLPSKWRRRLPMLVGGLLILGLCIGLRATYFGPDGAAAAGPVGQAGGQTGGPQSPEPKLQDVATVNGERISRNDLAREALRHYGSEVLEAMVNKFLILDACQAKNITVSQDEVAAELDDMAEKFSLSRERWLKLLEEERNITPAQYTRDIIWPSLALRKLAAARLEVSDQELQAAYETQFGPMVQVRLIACTKLDVARNVHALAIQNQKDSSSFGNLAKQYSEDVSSASAKGLVAPIRKHLGDAKLEAAAFSLPEDGISDVLAIENYYVILRCDKQLPGRPVPMDQVREELYKACRDKKLRLVAGEIFQQLQKESRVEVIFGDPARQQQYPGVAAIINQRKITVLDLAEECIEREGKQVLEGTINRRVLEQAAKAHNVTVTDADMDEEIARAAISMGKTRPDGSPDVQAWLLEVTDKQKTTLEIYRYDVVWPTVALKKMVIEQVTISDDDLQKGFEANYGPRAKVRAIVFNNQRKAQEVWEMARNRTTLEFFSELAEEYSIEASSRALRGEVPPIQAHGGQPLLEKEAFALKAGELSGVIQLGDKYCILLSEGMTKPVAVRFDEVRELIYADVLEKKVRVAMSKEFNRLQDEAQIDNYLAGTTQSPNKGKKATDWAPGTSVSTRPAPPPQKAPTTLRR